MRTSKNLALRQKKIDLVEKLSQEITNAQCVLVANYKGIAVSEMTKLKKDMILQNSRFKVVKNNILLRALQKAEKQEIEKWVSGPTGVIFCYDNNKVIDIIKYIIQYQKDNPKFVCNGGYVFNQLADKAQIETISHLPSREVLIARIMGALSGPIQNFYAVLKAPLQSLMSVVEQLSQKDNKQS